MLQVEAILNPVQVTVRWPLSGIYTLDLRSNKLTAKSASARRKGFCLWQAYDINRVKLAVYKHFHPNQTAVAKAIAKQIDVRNMPHQKAKVLP